MLKLAQKLWDELACVQQWGFSVLGKEAVTSTALGPLSL